MIKMYGNEGQKYVLLRDLPVENMHLRECGSVFEIGNYYSVPHGYTSLKYSGMLLFIPDEIFKNNFVPESIYNQYFTQGDAIRINANGNLGEYVIENIDGDGHYITLELKKS